MKKRILLAAMALMIVSGCSNGEETSVSEPESTAESSIVSVVESMESSVKESSVESKPESRVESKVESKPESKVESSKAETSVPATNAELPGFYNLVEMTSDGESLMSMKYYNEAGLYITLEINAGGTGVFTQYQDKSNMTWNDNYMMLKDYDDMEYSLSGDKLAVYQSDVITLVFERRCVCSFE